MVAEDKESDATAPLQDDLPADNDQPDNMEVSGTDKNEEEETLQHLSQFETAPTHQRLYPSLPPMDTQLSFLTPSSQPSAPPKPLDTCKSPSKDDKRTEQTSSHGSPRITTLLALRSTRAGAKKPTTSTPPSSSSSLDASSLSSKSPSTILENLHHAKKQGGGATAGEAKLPVKTSPTKSGSSSKRKPSPKSVRHAVPATANKQNPQSGGNGTKPNRNATNASSQELDYETAVEKVRDGKGGSNSQEQASTSTKGGGEGGSEKTDVIIRTNTYTHLGTKRKSTGAFGSTSSTPSSSSSTENWETAQVSEDGSNNGSPSSPEGSSPNKRHRSLATPSAPSLRRALGGSAMDITPESQNTSSSSAGEVTKKNSRKSPQKPTKNGSSGHSRSLGIGSGLVAILSRPVAGKLVKSPIAAAAAMAQRKQGGGGGGEPGVKKESTSHSWLSQLFHKS